MERQLLQGLTSFALIGDDKVLSPHFDIDWKIQTPTYGVTVERTFAEDSQGRSLGFTEEHPIKDLQRDLGKLRHGVYSVDREGTLGWKSFVDDTFGDILPTVLRNSSLRWHTAPSQRVVELMGLENMMLGMIDDADGMHALYRFITDDMIAFIRWQEQEKLLLLNNGNDYVGSGSFGFTRELPGPSYAATGQVSAKDLWGNINSQETVGISPAMYHEFIYPYYRELAAVFGRVYYGCCEPVHAIWDDSVSQLPGLRKVSISAWCDEEFMGGRLAGTKVIYSRKPSPNFIGVEGMFDESIFTAHIAATLAAAKGCTLEFIFRDIYNLAGDLSKPGRAVRIVRDLIQETWQG
jgi:hypothetical protein